MLLRAQSWDHVDVTLPSKVRAVPFIDSLLRPKIIKAIKFVQLLRAVTEISNTIKRPCTILLPGPNALLWLFRRRYAKQVPPFLY